MASIQWLINNCVKIVLIYFICMMSSQALVEEGIQPLQWQSYTDAVFAQAKKEHKLVLVFAKATWCPWCQEMTKSFKDPRVELLVQYTYVPVLVDIDADIEIAKKYMINKLPYLIILNSDKEVLDSCSDYYLPQNLLNKLNAISYKYRKYYQ